MKLHLGCGQKYLEGYVNIDFPLSEHSIQEKSIADVRADITDLSYPASSVDEVRLHHVFEHFTRPVALGLIVSWRGWLKLGGTLRIEVPDFQKAAFIVLNPFSNFHSKSVALRHIFGSQEANWAIHYEGWTAKNLSKILQNLGFEILDINKSSWKGTYNFEVVARKNTTDLCKVDFEKIVENFLSNYLVDSSEGELKLLSIWMTEYNNQVEKCGKDD